MKPWQQGSGLTGRDLEKLDDGFKTETMDQIVPADSQGNHVAHGMASMHALARCPDGTIKFTGGGTEIAMGGLPDKDETT